MPDGAQCIAMCQDHGCGSFSCGGVNCGCAMCESGCPWSCGNDGNCPSGKFYFIIITILKLHDELIVGDVKL